MSTPLLLPHRHYHRLDRVVLICTIARAMLVQFVILQHFQPYASFCIAGWIDEDTPQDARVVTPLEAKQYVPPPSTKTEPTVDALKAGAITKKTTTSATATSTITTTTSTTKEDEVKVPRTYDLVFSDEFNTPHRTFHDGHDPRWTSLEKNDYTNDAQHYYSANNARTDEEGNLVIYTESSNTDIVGFNDVKHKNERVTKHFKSAMLQSWDKFCFAGGVVEAEMSLPGRHDVGGLWPAFWMLGNLARHTYGGSSEHVWPWSSTSCTEK